MQNKIILSIGTNIGNMKQNLIDVVKNLNNTGKIKIDFCSNVYETAPMYEHDQNNFNNMALIGYTNLTMEQLLNAVKKIEDDMGRVKIYRNGPRVIDIDISYYNDEIYNAENLNIPHISIEERHFVLQPIMDIAPNHYDPRTNKTITHMFNNCIKDTSLSQIYHSNEIINN